MDLGPGSMASAWMVGREEEPAECGEIFESSEFKDMSIEDSAQSPE